MTKITSNYNFNAIRKRMNAAVDQQIDNCIEAYKRAGMEFVDTAQKNKTFGNITYDLVSSMGCILVVNHEVVFEYFPASKGNGANTGKSYAREIALLIDEGGIMLICVAGMQYARAVEDKGKDVITGTDLKFSGILKRHLSNVGR
jgi:hypothetical protein